MAPGDVLGQRVERRIALPFVLESHAHAPVITLKHGNSNDTVLVMADDDRAGGWPWRWRYKSASSPVVKC